METEDEHDAKVQAAIRLLTEAGYEITSPPNQYDPDRFWEWLRPVEKEFGWDEQGDLQMTGTTHESELVIIFGWTCGSCREDVGWCKHADVTRDRETGAMRIWFECGHCGDRQVFDPTGEQHDVHFI